MDFRELQYVSAVAKYQNITKAAESLYIGQPTLSKAIQNLESTLGLKLFRKLGNRFVLTYAGEIYVKKAEQILMLKKELDQEMQDVIKSDSGILKVAFPVMRGSYMLPITVPAFSALYPNVKLDIVEADSSHLEDMLLKGETDLAFCNLPVRSKDIDYELISHEELVLLMKGGHPMAEKAIHRGDCKYPWLSLDLLREEPFILFTQAQRTRQISDSLFDYYHMKPNVFLSTRNIQAALQLASMGLGATFVSETHLRHVNFETPPQRFSIGEPPVTIDFAAIFRRNSYLPHYAKEFIKLVKQYT